jgi:hypothetical protein
VRHARDLADASYPFPHSGKQFLIGHARPLGPAPGRFNQLCPILPSEL